MTTLTNSAEGGTAGNTVTAGTTGGASGDAFNAVTTGTGTTNAFGNEQAAHGSLSYKIASAGTAASAYESWTTSMGTQTQVWFRVYFYMTAAPPSDIRIVNLTSAGTRCAAIWLSAANSRLRWNNAADTTIVTTTNAVAYNQWFRIEGTVIASTTVGQVELKLFNSADSTTETETLTSAATQVLTASMSDYRFGTTSTQINVGPFWMDDLGLSDVGYMGPAVTAGPPQAVVRPVQSGLMWRP